MKKIVLYERKLGRERAAGQAWDTDRIIEIDPRQTPRVRLDTIIHEWLHIEFPALSETQIRRRAGRLTKILWEDKWRKIHH
ncbi:MAG: hypothetical protein ABI615_14330 [Chthoniobacterales bacterium]